MIFRNSTLAAVLLALCSCASSNDPVGTRYIKSAVIGPSGGSLQILATDDVALQGTSISIPANALATPTTITIAVGTEAVAPAGTVAAGPVVDFGPDGTTFAVPATITLPYALPAGTTAETLSVSAVESDGSQQTFLPSQLTVGASTVTFAASGFTNFGCFLSGRQATTSGTTGSTGTTTSGTSSTSGTTGTTSGGAVLGASTTQYSVTGVPVGDVGPALPVTFSNTGTEPTGAITFAISGTGAAAFAVASTTCGPALDPAASCTANVTFTPSAGGTVTASLTATASPGGSVVVPLSGSGVLGGAELNLQTNDGQFFGTVPQGWSNTLSVEAENFGMSNTGALTASLAGSADFSIVGSTNPAGPGASDCMGAVLSSVYPAYYSDAGLSECFVSVVFSPTTTAEESTTLTVSDPLSGSSQQVTLYGNVSADGGFTSASVPAPVFGLQATASLTIDGIAPYEWLEVTLNNTSSQAVSSIGPGLYSTSPDNGGLELYITGSGTGCAGATLAPNASCTVYVGLASVDGGIATSAGDATLTFYANGFNPAVVAINGAGITSP